MASLFVFCVIWRYSELIHSLYAYSLSVLLLQTNSLVGPTAMVDERCLPTLQKHNINPVSSVSYEDLPLSGVGCPTPDSYSTTMDSLQLRPVLRTVASAWLTIDAKISSLSVYV